MLAYAANLAFSSFELRCRRSYRIYSDRNARIGSIEAARSAGNPEAATANNNTPIAATDSISGSNGLTPKRNERSNPEAAAAPPPSKSDATCGTTYGMCTWYVVV